MEADQEKNMKEVDKEDKKAQMGIGSRFSNHFPDWLIWYKKPEYRDIKEYASAIRTGARPLSRNGHENKGPIPSRLSLERVLDNKTCSPMSLYDFYMYLQHIEFSSENLEFFIWFRNYKTSYERTGSLTNESMNEKEASPVSSSENSQVNGASGTVPQELPSFNISSFASDPEAVNQTMDNIIQLIVPRGPCQPGGRACSISRSSTKSFLKTCPTPAARHPVAPPPVAPSPVNPVVPNSGYRVELHAVVENFLLPGSSKELNIPPAMRDIALQGLQHSSNPEHLQPIADHVYGLLKNCSHRNFVRLGVSNGTFETLCMATSVGIVLTIAGFLCVLLRMFVPFSGAHVRWNAFAPWPMWFIGMSLILSGLRGSCFFLLLFTRRQPLPWERFDDSSSLLSQQTPVMKFLSRMMIFDRKIRVNDTHLRHLQHKIVIQAMVGGMVFANLCVLLFIFLPVWS